VKKCLQFSAGSRTMPFRTRTDGCIVSKLPVKYPINNVYYSNMYRGLQSVVIKNAIVYDV